MKKINQEVKVPKGFIIFISGVPGVGKTTISYELLKRNNEFRIIEETDLVREVLRGYNDFLKEKFNNKVDFIFDEIHITNHTKLLNFDEAKEQCYFMKKSFKKIIERQQRKGIPSIINGVHIIPELLEEFQNNNIMFINLYVTDKKIIYNRIKNRNPTSYMLDHVQFIYQTNMDLYKSTMKLSDEKKFAFNNIDVTNLTIDETLDKIIFCINNRVNNI